MWNASHLTEGLCALRHWKRVSMPPTTQSLRHPLTRAFHFAPRIKTARRFTAKNPWKLWFIVRSQTKRTVPLVCTSVSNNWYSIGYYNYGRTWNITSLLGFGFSPKARGFYPFGDATALAGEGGVGDVVWLIQASAWNQTCHSTNDRCEALASQKAVFFMFLFQSLSIFPLNRINTAANEQLLEIQ